jgi:hypothetical protein
MFAHYPEVFQKKLFFNKPPSYIMPRPVTLFTGQWADLSLPDLAAKAAQMGYDGLELACWGDHFDVDKAAVSKKYCKERWEILSDHWAYFIRDIQSFSRASCL